MGPSFYFFVELEMLAPRGVSDPAFAPLFHADPSDLDLMR